MARLQPSIQPQKLNTSVESESQFSRFQKKTCRYCDTGLSKPFLDLGISPLANSLPLASEAEKKEFVCPLRLVKCSKCHLVQLSHVVPGEMMFSNYLYVSSTTQTFRDHFSEYAKQLKDRLLSRPSSSPNVLACHSRTFLAGIQSLDPRLKHSGRDPQSGFLTKAFGNDQGQNALAVDIGSNDGLLVSCYKREGLRAVGVEPAENLSKLANENGHTTINRFFDAQTVDEIVNKYGRADIVSGNNVFAHIDDIQSVLRNVNRLLDDAGIFVIEFPYLGTMLDELLFDMIYHEHLSYISVVSLNHVLTRFGFNIFKVDCVSSHGGSLRVFIQKSQGPYEIDKTVKTYLDSEKQKGYEQTKVYERFAANVRKVGDEIKKCVSDLLSKGRSVSGYGAPAKATTLTNFCVLTHDQIEFVVDDNPLKQNRLVPGTKIPIVSSDYLLQHPTDYVMIFAWNFAKEILAKLTPLKDKGTRFIIPLPSVKIV